jgi:hypothetical protein
MFERKGCLKDVDGKEKGGQKEDVKREKQNKSPKRTSRRKISHEERTLNDVHCGFRYGNELRCDDCQNFCSKICVKRYHQDHSPNLEDGDNVVCHNCYKEDNTDYSTSQLPKDTVCDNDVSELHMLATQK